MTAKRISSASQRCPGRRRSGMTVLELLVAMGVISTLTTLILPAVQSAREAARRTQCCNQLKQLGLALHGYHEQWQSLPAAWQFERTGNSQFGWAVPLLPLLEQQAVSRQVDRGRRLDDSANSVARDVNRAADLSVGHRRADVHAA